MSLIRAEDVKIFTVNFISERFSQGDLDAAHVENDSFDFLQAGIIDSLGIIEMIMAMEKHFHITVDFEQMDPEKFTCLGAFSLYVAENAIADGGSNKA